MAELEEKLNAILGNPDAMGQIMALARSLNGGVETNGAPTEQSPPPEPGETPPPPPASQPEVTDLSALLGQVDPRLMQMGLSLLKNCKERDDRNAALLRALRPFLKEERRAGLDRALQIVGVTRIIRAALETMGGKGEEGRV